MFLELVYLLVHDATLFCVVPAVRLVQYNTTLPTLDPHIPLQWVGWYRLQPLSVTEVVVSTHWPLHVGGPVDAPFPSPGTVLCRVWSQSESCSSHGHQRKGGRSLLVSCLACWEQHQERHWMAEATRAVLCITLLDMNFVYCFTWVGGSTEPEGCWVAVWVGLELRGDPLMWSPCTGVGEGLLSRSGDSVSSAGSASLSKELDQV